MVDIRTIAIALEAYARDHHGRLPATPALVVPHCAQNTTTYSWPPSAWPVSASADVRLLLPALQPKYVTRLPVRDRWGYPFRCAIREDLASYTIVSFGSDGIEDAHHPRTSPRGESARDLILSDGVWISMPDGTSI